jgi:hypothetical protein
MKKLFIKKRGKMGRVFAVVKRGLGLKTERGLFFC